MRIDMRSVARMTVAAIILSEAAPAAFAAEGPLPWSFVNGSAKGDSIQLVSASPVPGTKVAVGQTVEFRITVSYQLSIAAKGSIILVVQDENNKNLQEGKPQQSQLVDRGKGTITLTESFVVPAGFSKVRLIVSLVPQGIQLTDGELVLRYPVSNEVKSSTIGYPSVAAALADLHSKPEVQFRDGHGWTIAEDSSHHTFWLFPPPGSPAYPSAVQRVIVQGDTGISLKSNILCESTQSACDKLVADFQALNQRVQDSFKGK